jgi:hypothetical protein
MDSYYSSQECTSHFHHDEWSVGSGVLHYFGCLKFAERRPFFDALEENDKLRTAILEEESRTNRLRGTFEAEGSKTARGRLLSSFKIALSHRFPTAGRRPSPPRAAPPNPRGHQSSASNVKFDDIDLAGLNANVIYFKDNLPYDHPAFDGTFPNQTVPLARILKHDEKGNPLMWNCEKSMIRYFHLPANNMAWVEASIFGSIL